MLLQPNHHDQKHIYLKAQHYISDVVDHNENVIRSPPFIWT